MNYIDLNRQKVVSVLQALIKQTNTDRMSEEKNDSWRYHTQVERGNAGVQL